MASSTGDTAPGDAGPTATSQVLEFDLGEETYCVNIDYVAEIVDTGDVTSVPNSPQHVEGVMDLRGQTTTIVDPRTVYGTDTTGEGKRIIVFDPEAVEGQGAMGWIVDEVHQVVEVTDANVDDSPVEGDDSITGIIKRDDQFVIWVDPESAHT